MIQEYNSINKLLLVILKCLTYIVFGVACWFGVFLFGGVLFFLMFVSLDKELMFTKWGKRSTVPNYDSLKSVKPITVKTLNLQNSTKPKPRNHQISLLTFLSITSRMQIKLLCHGKLL